MAAAAKHLTPVTLELGGKSPCLVDQRSVRRRTSKKPQQRIIWGKALNAGQTCVAPDYVLVHQAVKQDLVNALQAAIRKFLGANPLASPDFGKIIHADAFDRLQGMITAEKDKIICGGAADRAQLKIELTLIDQPALDSPLMTGGDLWADPADYLL